jgi:hypothetical protein
MRVRHLVIPLYCGIAVVAAQAAQAQDPDSVVFHRGQWGADFRIGSGFSSAGAIHFSSATHAQLVDIGAGYSHNTSNQPGNYSAEASGGNASLRLGIRSYHSIDRRLYRWTTFGVAVNYNRQTNTYQDTLTSTSVGGGMGLFANVGATWLVTPHLGIGALWEIGVNYNRATIRGYNGSETNEEFSLSLANVALAGQIYF